MPEVTLVSSRLSFVFVVVCISFVQLGEVVLNEKETTCWLAKQRTLGVIYFHSGVEFQRPTGSRECFSARMTNTTNAQ